jgi:hypothetical protein
MDAEDCVRVHLKGRVQRSALRKNLFLGYGWGGGGFRGFEVDGFVGSVAEGLVGGVAAAAERDGSFSAEIPLDSVGVYEFEGAFDAEGAVEADGDAGFVFRHGLLLGECLF